MSLTRKTLVFLQYVFERYDAEYIVKVDDDVYLRTDRLPHILSQWKLHGAGKSPLPSCLPVNMILASSLCHLHPFSVKWAILEAYSRN